MSDKKVQTSYYFYAVPADTISSINEICNLYNCHITLENDTITEQIVKDNVESVNQYQNIEGLKSFLKHWEVRVREDFQALDKDDEDAPIKDLYQDIMQGLNNLLLELY